MKRKITTIERSISRVRGTPSMRTSPFQITPVKYDKGKVGVRKYNSEMVRSD